MLYPESVMDPTLGGFLARLEAAGELHRVSAPVSPILEIAEVALRHSKTQCKGASRAAREFDPGPCDLGGKPVLFERVDGSERSRFVGGPAELHGAEA